MEIVQRERETINFNGARLEHAKYNLVWGTYGKGAAECCGGTCPEHQLRWVRLIDCATEHLLAILRTQHHIPALHRIVINMILEGRKFEVGLSEKSLGILDA